MNVVPRDSLEFMDLPGRRAADPLSGRTAVSSLRIVQLERTEGRTAHRHPYSEEVVVVARGSGEVWIDGVRSPLSAGDVVHIPAGAAHATIPASGVEMELVCFFPHPDLNQNIEDTEIRVAEER